MFLQEKKQFLLRQVFSIMHFGSATRPSALRPRLFTLIIYQSN
jgi:hypothetical protein